MPYNVKRTFKLADGKVVPAIAWGSGTGGLAKAGEKTVLAAQVALDAGIRHLDTAQLYGTEAETTKAIKEAGLSRDDVFITSKLSENTAVSKGTTKENVTASVKESLEKLGCKPDLYLIHNPFVPEEGKIAEFWTYLEDLVLDGTLEGVSLGVSNFRPQDIETVMKIARIKPVVNQVEYHPYVLEHLEGLQKLQGKYGIIFGAYGPLTPILRHPSGGPLKPVLERIGKARGIDEASVLLLWTIQKGVIAVTSSKNIENIKKIVALETTPDLSEQDIADIDEAGKKVHFRHYTEHMNKDYPDPDLPKDL